MKIAVIGGGISGMAVIQVLGDVADVTLFEAEQRIGGHTDTPYILVDGCSYALDSGFVALSQAAVEVA